MYTLLVYPLVCVYFDVRVVFIGDGNKPLSRDPLKKNFLNTERTTIMKIKISEMFDDHAYMHTHVAFLLSPCNTLCTISYPSCLCMCCLRVSKFHAAFGVDT